MDSLIDNPMVKYWECMYDLLLKECGLNEEDLDDIQETTLVMLIVASIKQLVTVGFPAVSGPSPRKRGHSAKDLMQMALEKEVVTTQFMVTHCPASCTSTCPTR